MSKDALPASEAALIAAKEKAVAEELAKMPSLESLEAEKRKVSARIAELEKLQDLKANYGDGKPGKKKFFLNPLAKGMGRITVNGEVMEGHKELTFEQYTSFVSLYSARVDHENSMKYGNGSLDITRGLAGTASVSSGEKFAKF